MRYLGIDYGTKRIGVAIADDAAPVAVPRGVIDGGEKEIDEIAALCKEEKIKVIVVGLPLTLRGEKGDMAKRVYSFAEKLRDRLGVTVELIDERMSTKASSGEGIRSADAAAAADILQTWLDRTKDARRFKGDSGDRGEDDEGAMR